MARRTSSPGLLGAFDLEPIVSRTERFLRSSPRGASRRDILAAMRLQDAVWGALREALEDTGRVRAVGRGPGLRLVHLEHLDAVDDATMRVSQRAQRAQELERARHTLRQMLQQHGEVDSQMAQDATGLRADPVRRLLLELVDEGQVERHGKKRSTRYRWVG